MSGCQRDPRPRLSWWVTMAWVEYATYLLACSVQVWNLEVVVDSEENVK
jgi:hypothetical protein